MAKLTFENEPYFDDFDADKNYFKVLFQPKRAIQTRELNQLQSILTSQTEAIGDHLFKFGSMVKEGSVRYLQNVNYVRLQHVTPSDEPLNEDYLVVGRTLYGWGDGSGTNATKLLGEIIHVERQTVDDPTTVYVKYNNTAVDGQTTAFLDGEVLILNDESGYEVYRVKVRCPTCTGASASDIQQYSDNSITPTGIGSLFAVEASTYYVHGLFVPVSSQSIVLEKYNNVPSFKIGFNIVQSIVTPADDESLYDNALGTPNYTAPGADRYKLELVLTKKELTDENDESFVLLGKVQAGILQEIKDKPEYGEIMKMLARRTYDESGDYTVRPFRVAFKEHLKPSALSTEGWLTAAQGGDSNKFVAIMGTGKAYVRGYEIEKIAESYVAMDKARDTGKKKSSVVQAVHTSHTFITLDALSNVLPRDISTTNDDANDYDNIKLYSGAASGGTFTGTQVGTARVKAMELSSGTRGTNAVYKIYLFDIKLNAGKTFADVLSLYKEDTQTFVANVVADPITGTSKLYEASGNTLLFPIPYSYVKSLRDYDDPNTWNSLITIVKRFTGTVNSAGNVVFSTISGESFAPFSNKWIAGLKGTTNFIDYDLVGKTSITATQVTIAVGQASTGKQFTLLAEVLVTGQSNNIREKTKTLTTVTLSAVPADATTISLGKADAFRVISVEQYTDGTPNDTTDVTSNYTLVKNIKDNYYDLSYLQLNSGVTTPASDKNLNIVFEYLAHSNDGDYFSIDSYTSMINDPDIDFSYEDVPTYTTKDNKTYNLSDVLDFRPTIGANGTFSGTGAVISNLPSDHSNIVFDIAYYLPRIDAICLSQTGKFVVARGISSEDPKEPAAPKNCMKLYAIAMTPYTYDVKKDLRKVYYDNKRYTMRDIGRIEKRIKNLEYYVSFNLLEKATADLEILDSSGNNRFKNGFLVDNFKNWNGSDVVSSEFRSSLDTKKGELRPSFYSTDVKLKLNTSTSSNFAVNSDVATMRFSEVVMIDQPLATKSVSVNPYFIYEQKGKLRLDPPSDVWKETSRAPDVVVSIDSGFDSLTNAGPLVSEWSDWEQVGSFSSDGPGADDIVVGGFNVQGGAGANTGNSNAGTGGTTNVFESTATQTTFNTVIQNTSAGDSVTQVDLIPFMRSIDIQFYATGMTPNTRVYAFFDEIDVNDNVRPLGGAYGEPLVTDSEGNLNGVFTVPNEDDKKFSVGDRVFRLTNSASNSFDPDELVTSAIAEFHAGGIREEVTETILSVSTIQASTQTITQQQTQFVANPAVPPAPNPDPEDPAPPTPVDPPAQVVTPACTGQLIEWEAGEFNGQTFEAGSFCWTRSDPLAQSFAVQDSLSADQFQRGAYVTSIDLYFNAKSASSDHVWVQIREMINGYPGERIIPYGESSLNPSAVKTSDDGSVATRFTFQAPVYLQAGVEYCFVCGSTDKAYRLYTAKLGGTTLGDNPVVVGTQPTLGSMFRSQNNTTWTADQFEDIKFTLNRALFDISTPMTLWFQNIAVDRRVQLQNNPFETQAGKKFVRVHHVNHGFVENDKVNISVIANTWLTINVVSGRPVVGQELVGNVIHAGVTPRAKIKQVKYIETTVINNVSTKVYEILVDDLEGYFESGEGFVGQATQETLTDPDAANAIGSTWTSATPTAVVGTFPTGTTQTFNGIPLADFTSTSHLIEYVDSMDSYVIQVDTAANSTGFVGGSGCKASTNVIADVMHMVSKYQDWFGDASFSVYGYTHAGIGSEQTNYISTGEITFKPNSNVFLDYPIKVANPTNASLKALAPEGSSGTESSISIKVVMSSTNSALSPAVNLTSTNLIAVNNRVDWNDCATYSIEPNATTNGNPAVVCDPASPSYNARWTYETDSTEGAEKAKYVMKPVSLKQPATNATVIMDVLKYLDSDIQVWFRSVRADLDEDIYDQEWVQYSFDEEVVSEFANDFKEVTVTIGDPTDPFIELPEFKIFQVKLVLKSRNSARPPKVKNFRAIAVT